MKQRMLSLLLVLCMVLPMPLLTSCGGDAEAPEGTYTRMTVDINPSVEFMIDDTNKIVSVTALNDDGSVLIAGEAFVGKTPEEALELMVTLSAETGCLVKGRVGADENEVKISVSGDSAYAKKLADTLEAKAQEQLAALDIEGKVARVEAMKTEALRTMAKETTPYTEEELAAMTDTALYAALAASRMETALLLTEEMREAYRTAKEHRISFAQSEATAEILRAMGGIYQVIYLGYQGALELYSGAITALDDFRYETLVSPDSEYQKSLRALREAKTDFLKQRSYVASLEIDGAEYASATLTLQASEERYDKMLAAYEQLGKTLDEQLTRLIDKLRESENALRALEEKFSEDIQAELLAKAEELEGAVNAAKDSFFAEFEAAHKSDIEAVEAALIAQKDQWKAAASGNDLPAA